MFSWCKSFLIGAILLSIAPISSSCQISHPAKRIISLAPDVTELLFAIGAGDSIVGVMRGSDYPKEALRIPVIAIYNHVNPEVIIALHPDLVVVSHSLELEIQLEFLKKFHIPVYVARQTKLLDIPRTLRELGCLTGHEEKANQAALEFLKEYENLRKKYATKNSVTVFYQLWDRPLITVNKSTMINEVIELCGGKNIFAELKVQAPEVNLEAVMQARPQVIIKSLENMLIERATPRILVGTKQICDQFNNIKIIKNRK